MSRARQLAPDSTNKRNSLAAAFFYMRRFDEALAIWRDATAVEANNVRRHLRLAFVYDAEGMRSDAMAEMLAVLRSSAAAGAADEVERTFTSHGYAAARQAFYRRHIDIESANHGEQIQIAADYAALGEIDAALEALSHAVASRETGANYLGLDPRFDALRSDTRFSALLRTTGVPQKPAAPGPSLSMISR
jgi:tetratricopeptide (TPR) repeat protein